MTEIVAQRRRDGIIAQAATFATQFLRSPLSVGSPLASSGRLVRRMLGPLPWSRLDVIVGYGSGTGSFTPEALQGLKPNGRLFAIDTDETFTQTLQETLPDGRLHALTGSAAEAHPLLAQHGVTHVDAIISGLPFSSLDPGEAARILDVSERLLAPDGLFVAYQVRSTLEELLRTRFRTVDHDYEWRHLPPCHLLWAHGSGGDGHAASEREAAHA